MPEVIHGELLPDLPSTGRELQEVRGKEIVVLAPGMDILWEGEDKERHFSVIREEHGDEFFLYRGRKYHPFGYMPGWLLAVKVDGRWRWCRKPFRNTPYPEEHASKEWVPFKGTIDIEVR